MIEMFILVAGAHAKYSTQDLLLHILIYSLSFAIYVMISVPYANEVAAADCCA